MSKGSDRLLEIICEIYGPTTKVIKEHCIGQRLRLDFFLPSFNLAFEYHGRQHDNYVAHYHKDAAGYRSSKRRDRMKIDRAMDQGITLIVIWHNEELTVEYVKNKILETLSKE